MIIGEVIGAQPIIDRLANGQRIQSGVERAIVEMTIRLQRHVVADKLSGQVLNVKTGRLRRSITQTIDGRGSAVVTGTVGTNLSYARVHELGFSGTENVRAHLRMMKTAFGKPVKDPRQIMVRASQRKVNIPAKSFLRSALADLRPDILVALDRAVKDATK